MMTIGAGLSATKTGFDLIKTLRDALGRPDVNPGDIQARLVELQSLMLDAQRALSDADEENRKLRRELEEAKRMSDFGKQFRLFSGVYWYETYPYCPVCWDVDRKPVRLSGPIRVPGGGPVEQWTCPFHKQPISLSWSVRTELNKTNTVKS